MAESQLTTKEQLRSIWQLGGLTVRQLAKRLWTGITEDNVLGRSSELAYNYLLAIFPFLVFLLTLFGIFVSRSTQLQSNLFFYFAQILPPAAFQLVTKTIDDGHKEQHSRKADVRNCVRVVGRFGWHDHHDLSPEWRLSRARIPLVAQGSRHCPGTDHRHFTAPGFRPCHGASWWTGRRICRSQTPFGILRGHGLEGAAMAGSAVSSGVCFFFDLLLWPR